jgi:hypothetical protein
MIEALYKWLCARTIVVWTHGKFKTFSAYLTNHAKTRTLFWLLIFLALGIALDNSTGLIQDHTRLSVFVSLLVGAFLGHLLW